ncbi:MAG: hypothetical protein LBP96_03895 [Bacteroidales bacterium]|jgi:hypothetical protein|nr:hypothetical protein [Bacteroidales bacterium]
MKKIIYSLCFLLVGMPFQGFSQWVYDDDEKDYKFLVTSIGAGAFLAGRHPANYYNGSNEKNSILYVFNNTYWYEQIKQEFNGWEPISYELPKKMRYKVSTAVGFRFSMNLSPYSSVFLHANQINLIATDIFTLLFRNPVISEPIRVVCNIWGKESRTMLDVGFQSRDETNIPNLEWFYELGFNMTNTKVKENSIQIGKQTFTLMNIGNYVPGQPTYDPLRQSAWGIGILGTIGWRYSVSPRASFDFGATAYLQDINLEGYKNFHPNFNVFGRLNIIMF